MLNIYDEESKKIVEEIHYVQEKWLGKEFTAENIHLMHNELVGRMNDLGFTATVDVTPLYEFQPVQVTITGRTEQTEFDHDKKRAEILKSRKEGGI